MAPDLKSKAWDMLEPNDYSLDVVAAISEKDLRCGMDEPPLEVLRSLVNHHRYMLLRANIDSGEGETLLQPWMRNCSDLMVADVCDDWSGQLAELGEEGWGQFMDWLEDYTDEDVLKGAPSVLPLLYRIRDSGKSKS
jgi:hypothetical protein